MLQLRFSIAHYAGKISAALPPNASHVVINDADLTVHELQVDPIQRDLK